MTVCHLPGPTMVGPACGQPLPINGGHRISRSAMVTCDDCIQVMEEQADDELEAEAS